jgi:sterol O-acyltransferase
MFILTVRTYVISFEQTGEPLSLGFASMFSRDATTLALSDGVLVGSTLLCVPFAKALQNGWIRYNPTGVILQHTFQATLLALAVTWTFNRSLYPTPYCTSIVH